MKDELLTGVFSRERWRPNAEEQPDNDFVIAVLESDEVVLGDAPRGDLIPGLTYRFFGRWEEGRPYQGRKQKQFRFKQFTRAEPHSHFGLVKYLERYAKGIGPTIAGRLFDQFGSDAVKVLREEAEVAVEAVKGLKLNVAKEAGEQLRAIGEFEDTKIELMNLFSGRGFSHQLPRLAVRKWGVLAPKRIAHDPFCLLVAGMGGCGFQRCDRLYLDLGLPPNRLKRLMLFIWHSLKTDTAGHTWHEGRQVVEKLRRSVSISDETPEAGSRHGNRVMRAIELGIRSGWLAVDRRDGGIWIADGEKAEAELRLAVHIHRLTEESEDLPRFTEAIEGECDQADELVLTLDEFTSRKKPVTEDNIETLVRQGRETGICQFCGRRLVSETSVELGYGPVCANRWNLPYGEEACLVSTK